MTDQNKIDIASDALHDAAADIFSTIASLIVTYATMIDWKPIEVVEVLAENFQES